MPGRERRSAPITPSRSGRLAIVSVPGTGSQSAAHPVNAILNYAYAVLQSELPIKAVADG
jgi:hypothetical protein